MNRSLYKPVPNHVAIIMDGNGRWARRRGLKRIEGHKKGVESVRAVLRACKQAGVKYLTLYAFSTENWERPKSEIGGLMKLLAKFLEQHESDLHEEHIRLRIIGCPEKFPRFVRLILDRVVKATEHYGEAQLILALNYGARDEITRAVRKIAESVKKEELSVSAVDETLVARHLDAPDIPDPDLMIRTSGEMRLSNFMLWQLSYSELYVTDTLWPDFRESEFSAALEAYAERHRRFGGVE